MPPLRVLALGSIAHGLLADEPAASVMGTTSRGLFLGLDSGWVVFLSTERWRGPLTLNVVGDVGCDVSPLLQHLPGAAQVWQAGPPARSALPPVQRANALQRLAEHASLKAKASPSGPLLRRLLGLDAPDLPVEETWWQQLLDLQQALREGKPAAIAQAALPWLGRGAGLTPSGDDLLLGLLLALNRWGAALAPALELEAANQAILENAWQHTTRLSASLLACAAQGQADERLLLALDGIMTGQPDVAACAEALAGWGNTSGLEALVGMAVGLKAFGPQA